MMFMVRCLLLTCALVLCTLQVSHAQHGPLLPGDVMPEMILTVPDIPDNQEYLGLAPDAATFNLADIKARAVLIEVFSMYCPICQKEAPVMNELYAQLQTRGLNERIKILGVGAGNSDLEVQVFREKYAVPFPLISDPDYVLHKHFGDAGTPYFLLVAPKADDPDRFTVLLSHLGSFETPDVFLDRLLSAMPD